MQQVQEMSATPFVMSSKLLTGYGDKQTRPTTATSLYMLRACAADTRAERIVEMRRYISVLEDNYKVTRSAERLAEKTCKDIIELARGKRSLCHYPFWCGSDCWGLCFLESCGNLALQKQYKKLTAETKNYCGIRVRLDRKITRARRVLAAIEANTVLDLRRAA